jgi:hypothetical protein
MKFKNTYKNTKISNIWQEKIHNVWHPYKDYKDLKKKNQNSGMHSEEKQPIKTNPEARHGGTFL